MPKKETVEELSKPITQDRVLDLIVLIEKKKAKIFKWNDTFNPTFWLVAVIFIAIAFITGSAILDFTNSLLIWIAGFSALMAYFSFFIQTARNDALSKNLKRARKIEKELSEKDRVLIMALVKIKSKNLNIDLRTLYKLDKEANGKMFTEKGLMEVLCK